MEITFDETRATGGDVITRLQELDRIFARLHAVQADLLVEAADFEVRMDEFLVTDEMTGDERALFIEEPIRDELACALNRSSLVMQSMIDTSRLLAGPLRPTWDSLRSGEISYPHVRIIVDAARDLPTELLPVFQARVLPRIADRTLARTRQVVRSVTVALDSQALERRRKNAKRTRDVGVDHGLDGLSTLWARLATEQAVAIMQTINDAARQRAGADDDRTARIGEHRADALATLVLGGDGATAAHMAAQLNVTIDLPTLLGLQNGTAELNGVGAVTVDVVRDLLADPDCHVTIRRLVTDPLTGHLLDLGRSTYAIPQRLREFILTRDRTCRFPGCNRRANLEIDHAIPWDQGGRTSPENLGALCKRHHQLKTHGGWTITESRANGACRWHSPRGLTYDHDPPNGSNSS